PRSLHVVQIEHGVLEPRYFEQALLRARIALHVAVIVEVIAREIGEQGGSESDAVDAPLLKADRGDFHRHTLRPRSQQLGKRTVQRNRIRRGVESRIEFSRLFGSRQGREPRAQSADQDRKSTRLNSSHVSISYAV